MKIKSEVEAMVGAKAEPKVVHATCVVERTFSKPAGVVFAALSDPGKVRRWMAAEEHSELLEFHCEFCEGGTTDCEVQDGTEHTDCGDGDHQ